MLGFRSGNGQNMTGVGAGGVVCCSTGEAGGSGGSVGGGSFLHMIFSASLSDILSFRLVAVVGLWSLLSSGLLPSSGVRSSWRVPKSLLGVRVSLKLQDCKDISLYLIIKAVSLY